MIIGYNNFDLEDIHRRKLIGNFINKYIQNSLNYYLVISTNEQLIILQFKINIIIIKVKLSTIYFKK